MKLIICLIPIFLVACSNIDFLRQEIRGETDKTIYKERGKKDKALVFWQKKFTCKGDLEAKEELEKEVIIILQKYSNVSFDASSQTYRQQLWTHVDQECDLRWVTSVSIN